MNPRGLDRGSHLYLVATIPADVGVNLKSVALTVMFNSLQVVKPVPIVPKDLLALIATDNDVVKR